MNERKDRNSGNILDNERSFRNTMMADLFLVQHLTVENTTAPQSEMFRNVSNGPLGGERQDYSLKTRGSQCAQNKLSSISLELIFIQSMIDVKE